MEYSIEISADGKFVTLKVVGDFTAMEMMKCTVEAHTLGKKMDIHCYFVDATSARNIDSAYGNYKFAYQDLKITEGIDPSAKVICLVSPGDHSHDFVETVANNAGIDSGMFFKLCTDPAEARALLATITAQKTSVS